LDKNVPQVVYEILYKQKKQLLDAEESDKAKHTYQLNEIDNFLDSISEDQSAAWQNQEFYRIIHNMPPICAKWLLKIVQKKMDYFNDLTIQQLLLVFHPRAPELFIRCSNLIRVCEMIESKKFEVVVGGAPLFHPIKPMLCENIDLQYVERNYEVPQFIVEYMIDGERMQLHYREDDHICWYSRSGVDYTHSFHEDFNASFQFEGVRELILDGIITAYDQKHGFYTRCDPVDIKKCKNHPTWQPFFWIFDILNYKGKNCMTMPYHKRNQLLFDVIGTEMQPTMSKMTQVHVSSFDEISNCLRYNFEMNHLRGVVLKDINSTYIPNSRGWFKIKPEYIPGKTKEMLVVIVGAFILDDIIDNYAVAVVEKNGDQSSVDAFAIGKVFQGLNIEEKVQLSNMLRPLFRPTNGQKTLTFDGGHVRFNDAVPDVWISPSNKSVVLEIRVAGFIKSTDFYFYKTMEFPKITMIREDKLWTECCTFEQFFTFEHEEEAIAELKIEENVMPGSDEDEDDDEPETYVSSGRKRPYNSQNDNDDDGDDEDDSGKVNNLSQKLEKIVVDSDSN